ncbi:hypothetical protein H7I53_23075 [Mycolicibacterium pulveris]|uniref:Uncharacterized protein n=1 Tax=Mycolicibacterium pulveris TaxID=36813 RepID=A0A7I7UN92_MYCPV|nr:hypothetical protein [Mycolicibacterium pulveris]MCV6983090.1 hypothetical protein [Mycolicibacterium pulveris]BBY82954.1 hypothetical protein MPUL_41120 [Mycolicibacterium pulveris]
MTAMRNGSLVADPVVSTPERDLVGDMFTALVMLLATTDKRVRWLADQIIADPDTDPARVAWLAVNYAARVYALRVLSTEAVRHAILREIDGLHLSMLQLPKEYV